MIAVLGESIVDMIQTGPETFSATLGGSPANVSIALARLGVPVSYIGRLSNDSLGLRLMDRLESNGVVSKDVIRADESSSLAVITLDGEGSANYSFYLSGTSDWQWSRLELPEPREHRYDLVHVGSLALAIQPGADVIAKWVQDVRHEGRTLISYDPNVRADLSTQRVPERDRLEKFARQAHLVKASEEDLLYCYPDESLDAIAKRLLELGPLLVVITRGSLGAMAYRSGHSPVEMAGVRVPVVDTIGAGDAFCAGLLTSLLDCGALNPSGAGLRALTDEVVANCLARANLVAALTCAWRGARSPTRKELLDAVVERAQS